MFLEISKTLFYLLQLLQKKRPCPRSAKQGRLLVLAFTELRYMQAELKTSLEYPNFQSFRNHFQAM